MTDQTKKNPGAAGSATEVKSSYEAATLQPAYATNSADGATHFWDRHSNSVQPIALIARGVCA